MKEFEENVVFLDLFLINNSVSSGQYVIFPAYTLFFNLLKLRKNRGKNRGKQDWLFGVTKQDKKYRKKSDSRL